MRLLGQYRPTEFMLTAPLTIFSQGLLHKTIQIHNGLYCFSSRFNAVFHYDTESIHITFKFIMLYMCNVMAVIDLPRRDAGITSVCVGLAG